MRLSVILPILLLSACASSGGEWPSLAHRPGETRPESPCDPASPAGAAAAAPAEAAPSPAPAAPADLDAVARRLSEAKTGWAAQRPRTEKAAALAAASSDAVVKATAELELSRLERFGGDFREIIEELTGVVTSPERTAALRAEAQSAYNEHVKLFNSLRNEIGS